MKEYSQQGCHWPSQRPRDGVIVHRRLELSRIRAVGIDLDHTLAVYAETAVNGLALAETCDNLVRFKGYPARTRGVSYDGSECARGLVLDLEAGNTLKLDSGRHVVRARGGGSWRDEDYIRASYGGRPLDLDSPRFETIDSVFDLPVVTLFTKAHELGPWGPDHSVRYDTFCADIRGMLDRAHRSGGLKKEIVAHAAQFVASVPELPDKLLAWAESGKKLFVLTNSEAYYTAAILDRLFTGARKKARWRELFDAVVVESGKPRFFDAAGPSARVDAHENGPMVSGGGAGDLETRLGAAPEEILYIGDNPFDDAAAARRRGWRTALVVPELSRGIGSRPPTPGGSPDRTAWGDPLVDGGRPTLLARLAAQHSDLSAAHVGRFLSARPDRVYEPV